MKHRFFAAECAIVASACLAAAAAWGQAPGPAPPEGDRVLAGHEVVVVTPSRRETDPKDAPVLVRVIDEERIEESPAQTVDDLLSKLPGITSMRTHIAECGPGREQVLRGVPGQKRTLVLVDGVPVNESGGGSVNWSVVSKNAVERIEIVPGPMSALYGSGAMGGVINMITKVPEEPNRTRLRFGGGSLGTFTGDLEQSGMGERHGYAIHLGAYGTEGYMKVKEPEDYHEKNDRNDRSFRGRYFFVPNEKVRLSIGGFAARERYSRGRIFTDQKNELDGGSLLFDGETDSGMTFSAMVFGNDHYRDVQVTVPPTYDYLEHTETEDNDRLGTQVKASIPLGDSNVFTLGADAMRDTYAKRNRYTRSDRRGDSGGKQNSLAVFAQEEFTFERGDHRWVMTMGARYDSHKSRDGYMKETLRGFDERFEGDSFNAFSPKAGIVYRYAGRTTVRAAAGTAFAAPTLSERYTLFERGPVKMFGNPDLEPEKSVSYNLGFDQVLLDKVLIRVDGYYTRGRDFIASRLSVPPFTYVMENISRVRMAGLDLDVRSWVTEDAAVYAGYGYTRSTVVEDESKPANEGNDLAFQPRRKMRVGVSFDDHERYTIDLSANFIGDRYTDIENTYLLEDYLSLDLHASWRFGEHIRGFVNLENMLDERYELYSLPLDESYAPGFLGTVGVEISF